MSRRHFAIILFMTCIGLGCGQGDSLEARRPERVTERDVYVADAQPDELAAVMEKATAEVVRCVEQKDSLSSGSLSVERIARQAFTGAIAADKILAHPDATSEQKQHANQMKTMVLFAGAQYDEWAFLPRLQKHVETLRREQPKADTTGLAVACLLELRCRARDVPKQEIFPLLADFAKSFPDNPAGAKLFASYAEKLLASGDTDGAAECYRQGLAAYADQPGGELLRGQSDRLESALAHRAAERARNEDAEQAFVARVLQRLGGQQDGYFVVYAEENARPPRHGGMYFVRFECEVLHGAGAVVNYVRALPDNWSWQLVGRFSDDEAGHLAARDLCQDVLKKKRPPKK
ncbi:MAG: hypothetical protein JW818_17275 [Pirellulales bacterium]|nr:hypothetical protein [Pirellulales bacterium]